MPINTQQEEEAAPILDANVDPFGHVDASTLAHANLNEKQRASADSQEKRLRTILGLSFNDLATSEAVSGAYTAALGHYQEAEHWNPTIAGLQKNLGLCAYRANNYPEAIRGLSRALVEYPSDAPVRAMLGMAYFGTDAFADAVKTFEPLGTRGMQDSLVGYAWAASLTRVGDLKKATEVLNQYEKGKLSNDALSSWANFGLKSATMPAQWTLFIERSRPIPRSPKRISMRVRLPSVGSTGPRRLRNSKLSWRSRPATPMPNTI